jgi:hypothetical protein
MFSPIESFSMQKLVRRASPMAAPPFSEIPQLKISNSTMDLLFLIKEATAKAPSSPILELRTLDGIHLVTAQKLGSEEVVTNDKRMRKAAQTLSMGVLPV